jgi:hypothetical protein
MVLGNQPATKQQRKAALRYFGTKRQLAFVRLIDNQATAKSCSINKAPARFCVTNRQRRDSMNLLNQQGARQELLASTFVRSIKQSKCRPQTSSPFDFGLIQQSSNTAQAKNFSPDTSHLV